MLTYCYQRDAARTLNGNPMQVRPQLNGISFAIEFVANPAQEDLAHHYRCFRIRPPANLSWVIKECACRAGFDLMLFLSRFEAWGMPVLEAMASGVPVVTSRCYGVEHFASHGVNCLMVPSRDVQVMLLFYSLPLFLFSPFFTQSCGSALIPCLICLHGITFSSHVL